MRIDLVKTIAFVVAVMLTITSCNSAPDRSAAIERHKRLAGELRDTKLYRAAIDEYGRILDGDGLDDSQRANINYLIGRIYYEDLEDYEAAAAHLVKAKALDPSGSFVSEASKQLVACLEKMGQVMDAKRQLDVATDLNKMPQRQGDAVVARIDGQPVWLSDVEDQIQLLPADLQKELTARSTKVDFVHQYVGTELIYRAAKREGYLTETEVRKQLRILEKKLLVDRYVLQNIMPQVSVDSLDVRNFYEANREERYDDQPYDSVKAQVFVDYSTEKAGAAFNEYIGRLAEAEKVEFLDKNVR